MTTAAGPWIPANTTERPDVGDYVIVRHVGGWFASFEVGEAVRDNWESISTPYTHWCRVRVPEER